MQVTVEAANGLERTLKIELPADRVDTAVESRLKDMQKRVRLDGFRPGKVPFRVVKQQYGAAVRQEVLGEVMEESYSEAVSQQDFRPAGAPSVESVSDEAGKVVFTAKVEVYPEFEPAAVDGIEVERPKAEVTDADVDKMIDTLRKQRQTWEAVERAAQESDRVLVSFKGTVDGEAFDGGSAEKMPVVLGEGRMLKDFEEPIVGMSAGEQKTIDVTFPEDYHAENLQGKTAQFEITLDSVSEPKLPEVDEDFMKSFGVESTDVDGFRTEIRQNMERELGQAVKKQVKEQVMNGLLEINEVELPQSLVQEEAKKVRSQMVQQFSQQMGGQAQDENTFPLDMFEDEGKRRVKLGLVVAEMIKANDIKVDAEHVDGILNEIAASYEKPEEVVSYYKQNPQLMSNIEALAVEDQVVEFVLDKAKVSDVEKSFDEVMNPSQETE